MNIVKTSLRHSQVTLILTSMLFAAGVWALMVMPRREDPKITIRIGQVAALLPGASAEEVENQLTRRVEERLFRFAEVRKAKTFSTSRPGIMIINVELEKWVERPDEFWSKLRHDLNETRIQGLPEHTLGPIVDAEFGDTVAVLLAIRGKAPDYRGLKDASERVEARLRSIPAVSRVKRYGEQREQIQVSSSPERFAGYRVPIPQLIGALRGRNATLQSGKLDTHDTAVRLDASDPVRRGDNVLDTIVGTSRDGRTVTLAQIATAEHRYHDPDFLIAMNGDPCIILSVEMQEGNNIVDFGREVRGRLDEARQALPASITLDAIADQPKVVEERIGHFLREFAISIGSVILVTMFLLPLRVATIAAVAIPVTVAFTFALLRAIGIELHQVSIAGLIVVLGMVVDDAIVIADNYVDLLDRGLSRAEAAWRCASDLAVPVLAATLTIVASFLPLVLVSGSVGEFILALPVAVAVALAVSYVVAMLLTPLLCRYFIHKGLHHNGESRRGLLDVMQSLYGVAIRQAMRHKYASIGLGVATFVIGVWMVTRLPERFFPTAERDQFVIDIWQPEGTRIEATRVTARRIEKHLAAIPEIRDYTTFLGASAPRFYYNVDPQQPSPSYAQILVNTRSAERTPGLVYRLRGELDALCPEARVLVKELEQGDVISAPIEVRITGDDVARLRTAAREVEKILAADRRLEYVHHDYRENVWTTRVVVEQQLANRLGVTNADIARQLQGGFDGMPVSTVWDGKDPVDLVLRLDAGKRSVFEDVGDSYVESPVTGVRVPLRSVARLEPKWEEARIVRRNGVRTITVRAHPKHGELASTALMDAKHKIGALPLPAGYAIHYGGEEETQNETFDEMKAAMVVSLAGIFVILLIQFRNGVDPLVVMMSIPLSLPGAAAGLMLTGNPFGFTAFLGLVSLTGVVVRNAIILVDYIREKTAEGMPLEEAAREAGARRLRPVFLTSAAAAVGVTPMILSGSALWSPLASVLAVGLMSSMVFTLVLIPVVYVVVGGRHA
ncbi:MAG: efflux RND transporter permease subunit [Bryobacterales bacterium]|nr:efflux RND transporter permease subunit [Bryobacterales bacterium]